MNPYGSDRPLTITKLGIGTIVTHQNWRAQLASGTWAIAPTGSTSGERSDCYAGAPSSCAPVNWPGWRTSAYNRDGSNSGVPGDARYWFGSLASGMEDASGQQYMRNRYFDPKTGQFTQADPIGLGGGLNPYGFAEGDPVSYADPYGLKSGGCPPDAAKCGAEIGVLVSGKVLKWLANHAVRNAYNAKPPPTRDQADQEGSGWIEQPQEMNAFHRYGPGNEKNVKYMSEGGHHEVVYGADGTPVTDPTNTGTYNYGTTPVDHIVQDVLPYVLFGNRSGDETTLYLRLYTTYEATTQPVTKFLRPQKYSAKPSFNQAKCAPYCE